MNTHYLAPRHIGISEKDLPVMLKAVGVASLDELIKETIPADILKKRPLNLPKPMTEREYAEHIDELASKNIVFTSYIGQGWYDTVTPAVVLRNVFENPVWYTSYTPYQAEISQGRLEALLNFQTVISDMTALPLANCSLLDEATAGAEAATMMYNLRSKDQVKKNANKLFVDNKIFAHTKAVIHTRMIPQGIDIVIGDYNTVVFTDEFFGAIIQYPDATGSVNNYSNFVESAHRNNLKVAVAADILSLALLTPPGEWGADICFGSTQRFGIPMFYGGPSAGFFATKEEYKRSMPGRIIGYSKDAYGKTALRMALQTREQHIKREKATSNICTAQALLATMASFYAVYNGPEGIKSIAQTVHKFAGFLAHELTQLGYIVSNHSFFDTLTIIIPDNVSRYVIEKVATDNKVNLYYAQNGTIGISIDETTNEDDINTLLEIFATASSHKYSAKTIEVKKENIPSELSRTSTYLLQPVFNSYHTETDMMRYIKKLERRDISLAHSMIPLGSCTMKMNAASEMIPLNNLKWGGIHPLAPSEQTKGYSEMIESLSNYLCEITNMDGVSLQPNSGAGGEYAGLRTIRSYQLSKGEGHRNIVLIPASAHGTNPASAAQCGYSIVVVACDEKGNVNMDDLRSKATEYRDNLAAFMITYPSTHGIFEAQIVECCKIIHDNGGQVYMDGANMNAQVGLTSPGFIGADVCHLNLHKTFAIPHGGGGPGVGPICAKAHLVPFLPHHPYLDNSDLDTVSSSPFGSAGVLEITYGYIRMMGADGLTMATKIAILNANYLASVLGPIYGIVYTGINGRIGHELILDCRKIKDESGIDETDISKRLMDYGYHAPTLSFPVHGTLMIEPTESESLHELTLFCDAMINIYREITEVVDGVADKDDNVLKNSPHPQYEVCGDNWNHSYTRTKAAFPLEWIEENKFWTNVARIDNALGDRNLIAKVCNC
ncbi:MAG: aminomethyl-transferring glycine dehydrogenase [Bacteroidales bacterium]|nr:aminomethyl-transferring glycine dehydrogenase [Bacteroidales bacterium]